MRAFAISALLALAVLAVPAASAAPPSVPVHVEFVQCVTAPCPPQVWCDPADKHDGAVHYERFHDCSERISIDFIDCIFGEHWESVVNTPALVIRYSACNQP